MSSRWDSEIIYFSGDQYFEHLLKAIDSANRSILFETYIFDKGVLGDRIVNALVAAAQRGVKIKLLIDGIGSPAFSKTYLKTLRQHKIGVRFYRALPWILQRLPGENRQWHSRMAARFKHFNKGNHRKFTLIDDYRLFIGSFNVSDVHSETLSKDAAWKDIGAEVQGSEVSFVRKAFRRAYRRFRFPAWSLKSPRLVLLNDSFILKRFNKLQKLDRLRNAQDRILLETPYFVPPGYILRALVKKAKNGLKIQVIVPFISDVKVVQWMSYGIIHYLSRKGIQFFFYKPRFNHQKIFIIDDWMCLGSTNLNHRSFLHDLEMDVVITHPENKILLNQSFIQDLALSEEYHPDRWSQIPLLGRWIGNFLLMLRYWA